MHNNSARPHAFSFPLIHLLYPFQPLGEALLSSPLQEHCIAMQVVAVENGL